LNSLYVFVRDAACIAAGESGKSPVVLAVVLGNLRCFRIIPAGFLTRA